MSHKEELEAIHGVRVSGILGYDTDYYLKDHDKTLNGFWRELEALMLKYRIWKVDACWNVFDTLNEEKK